MHAANVVHPMQPQRQVDRERPLEPSRIAALDAAVGAGYRTGNVAANFTVPADFDALYRKYSAIVQRRAWSILGDEQSAKDAAQEVFLRVIRAQEHFRGDSSLTSWIYRITTNYCLNVIRDRARRVELLAEASESADLTVEPATAQIVVSRVLERLPEELRTIAVYFFVDQMNRDEIAALLGVSRRTVGYRLEEFRILARELVNDPERKAV